MGRKGYQWRWQILNLKGRLMDNRDIGKGRVKERKEERLACRGEDYRDRKIYYHGIPIIADCREFLMKVDP